MLHCMLADLPVLQLFAACFRGAFFEHSDSWKVAWLQIGYQLTVIYLFSLEMSWVPSCTPELSTKDVDVLDKFSMVCKRSFFIEPPCCLRFGLCCACIRMFCFFFCVSCFLHCIAL